VCIELREIIEAPLKTKEMSCLVRDVKDWPLGGREVNTCEA
jgi:hypothetical protein